MIFRVDKDRVVWTRRHTRLASYADGLVKVDDAIRALEHGRGWACCDTRRVSALIASRDLVCTSRLRKFAYIHVLDVSACNRKRHIVLGLAGCSTRVTADTPRVIYDLCPLNRLGLTWMDCEFSH